MSTTQVSDRSGGEPDMRHVHAGAARWRKEQERLKKREVKEQLAAARHRERELSRVYWRAFDRASDMPERRGAAAIGKAFDEADRAMNRLLSAQADVRRLEGVVRSVQS